LLYEPGCLQTYDGKINIQRYHAIDSDHKIFYCIPLTADKEARFNAEVCAEIGVGVYVAIGYHTLTYRKLYPKEGLVEVISAQFERHYTSEMTYVKPESAG
jgi:hypothetical protein